VRVFKWFSGLSVLVVSLISILSGRGISPIGTLLDLLGNAQTVQIRNAFDLQIALLLAQPGQTLTLAPGIYRGSFMIATSGTADQPITLQGNPDAVLDGGTFAISYGLMVRADYWRIDALNLRNAKKGIVLHGASHNVLSNVHVEDIGEEGIRLRDNSRDNTIEACAVTRTGLLRPGFGEGIYIGSAHESWAEITGGEPDRSDNTRVLNCVLGPEVGAELIDIKEGTSGGIVRGNTLDGTGISGENYADSLFDVKGNGYLIEANRAIKPGYNAMVDGIQVHRKLGEWGVKNVLRNNTLDLNVPGYGIHVQIQDNYNGGNVVEGNNTIVGAQRGYSNIGAAHPDDIGFHPLTSSDLLSKP
jgi:hypothetical protein